MVDDDHVGGQRLAPRAGHVAVAKPGAFAAQAVVARGSDQGDDGRALVQLWQLGQIARGRGLRPALDAGQLARGGGAGGRFMPGQLQPVGAQVAAAAFEQGRAHGQAQRANQARQIAAIQLVLQRFGGRGQQRALAAQQHGRQIGKGLAHARGRFGHQRAAFAQRLRHGQRHLHLAGTGAKSAIGRSQRPIGRENGGNAAGEIRQGERVRKKDARRRRKAEWKDLAPVSFSFTTDNTQLHFWQRQKIRSYT